MRSLSQNKMEVASFLKKLTKKPSPNIGCFLAVQIDTEFIKTAVWGIKNDLPEIIGVGGTAQWDGTSVEVLLEAIDTSLSVALEKIPEKVGIAKAIFGLPEAWVSPESILPARLNDIKIICEKMAFKPLGFVITTEAIAQYLKAKEGTPASAILIRVSTSEVTVSIIRLGIIEATHIAGRSGDIASDVKEGLTRFGDQESLPSRIILYDGTSDRLDELTQQLLVSDWYSSFPFLHIFPIGILLSLSCTFLKSKLWIILSLFRQSQFPEAEKRLNHWAYPLNQSLFRNKNLLKSRSQILNRNHLSSLRLCPNNLNLILSAKLIQFFLSLRISG